MPYFSSTLWRLEPSSSSFERSLSITSKPPNAPRMRIKKLKPAFHRLPLAGTITRGTRWTARGVPPGTFAPTARCWAMFERPLAVRPLITLRAMRARGRWKHCTWSPGTGEQLPLAGAFSRVSTTMRVREVRPSAATVLLATRALVSDFCHVFSSTTAARIGLRFFGALFFCARSQTYVKGSVVAERSVSQSNGPQANRRVRTWSASDGERLCAEFLLTSQRDNFAPTGAPPRLAWRLRSTDRLLCVRGGLRARCLVRLQQLLERGRPAGNIGRVDYCGRGYRGDHCSRPDSGGRSGGVCDKSSWLGC